jgi:hypothetical protein
MKEKVLVLGIIILFFMSAISGCVKQESQLQLSITTDKTSFATGDVISISLNVKNSYPHDFQLNMTGNTTYVINISDSNNQLIYGRNYWDVWGKVTIPANSEKTIVKNYTWNQTDSIDNKQVPPGVYSIDAILVYVDNNKTSELESNISITIS